MSASNRKFDIAIVGMSGRFPGARDLDAFWRNLAHGVESIARLSDRDILESGVPASHLNDASYVKAAPVLDRPDHFDAGFFGFSPLEARNMDPQHRLLLELAYEALEDAACDPDRFAGRIGVFAGAALNTYFLNVGLHRRLAEDYIPTLIGNDKDFLATRVSYKLDLKGPSITVQTACSTSLVALHLACQSLLAEECDLALAGAVSVRVPHRAGYFCDGGGVVSPNGHVRAFDAAADGTVFGSGGGVLALKRFADALADGDTIRAVIKGSAVNNDGAAKVGYTAPSVDSQASAVVEALANAGVDADSISYVEAHGSGTPVGDPMEILALAKAFRAFTQRAGYCAVGSVKTNIGHLDAAAAVAGVIKTVLALEHRQLPPSLNFSEANPEIDFAHSPFYVNTQLREWTGELPRRAGVMSTGMGGTNAHIVLEEAPAAEASVEQSPHLLLLSARTESALDEVALRLREFLRTHRSVNMGDVAHTLRVGRKAWSHRRCLVCSERGDAIDALSEPGSKRVASSLVEGTKRPVILLLPGLGDHYVGMGCDLYQTWPSFREDVDRCARLLEPHLGTDIRTVLYPESGSWRKTDGVPGIDLKAMLGHAGSAETPEADRLDRTLFAQPALFTIEYATARLWQALGITPDAIIGHSMGEYVAACLAGVMALDDALRLIATRARLVESLPRGGMLAVTLTEAELRPLLSDDLSISLINSPSLCVVAGPVDAVSRFEALLERRGVMARRVRNAHAFHSSMLDPIAPALEEAARSIELREPTLPCMSNVSGTWMTHSQATSPGYWAQHATKTARFNDGLHELWRFEHPILLEAGPGRTLSVLAMQHPDRPTGADDPPVTSIRHVYENRSDVEHLLHALGRLWLSGVAIDWNALPTPAPNRRIPLPTYPFERESYWLEPATAPVAPAGAPTVVQKNPDRGRWLYVPSWKRVLPRAIGVTDDMLRTANDASWLVFADDAGYATELIGRLEAAGHETVSVWAGSGFTRQDARTFTIEPANPQHYDALIRALETTPDHIVHAWSVPRIPAGRSDEERFELGQETGFYSLLFLARALASHPARREVRLFVLSSDVHEISGAEDVCPDKATLLGPCMTISQEYPDIRVTSIDIDASDPAGPGGFVADRIIGELLDPDASLFVAHRNGQRWVQTHEPATVTDSERRHSVLRERGVYLITGGLGEIGVAVSEYLASEYRARLVLVGRTPLAAEAGGDERVHTDRVADSARARIRAINRIESSGGEVLYVDADVSDERALRRVLELADQRFSGLDGVIHAAGIVGDHREIGDSEPPGCEAHFRAKAHGVRVLAKVLDGRRLDFCLLMSSLTSVLGGIGQSAYASSNLYMDAFARRHNRASAVPWLSVNWDVWRMHDAGAGSSGLGTTLRDLGMSAGEATAMLETVLALRAAGQLVVSTGDLDARIDQWIRLESLRRPAEATLPSPVRQPLSRSAADTPASEIEQQVARIWQNALGVEAVGLHDGFAELGGHSLLAVRIVAELRRAYRIELPVRVLFDAPTVTELSQLIEERLIAEIDALSDDEAQRLVSSS